MAPAVDRFSTRIYWAAVLSFILLELMARFAHAVPGLHPLCLPALPRSVRGAEARQGGRIRCIGNDDCAWPGPPTLWAHERPVARAVRRGGLFPQRRWAADRR